MSEAAFCDVASERAVVSGVLQYGRDGYLEAADLIDEPARLTDEFNQVLWACMTDFYESGTDRKLDVPSLMSAARKLNLFHVLEDEDAKKHIARLIRIPIELETVRPEAQKVRKLAIGRELDRLLWQSRQELKKITGDESLAEILGHAETPIFEYSSSLGGDAAGTKHLGEGCRDWLDYVQAHPTDNAGIPSPFPKWNKVIGGGFRRRTNTVVAARPKNGKSAFADNLCLHVAGTLGIPVFNLDTEMSDEEHWARILAALTGIPIETVESGRHTKAESRRLREKADWLRSIPYYYRSVIDESFDEQVAAMRRWVVKSVGSEKDGTRKPCLVVYDYLQLTDEGDFKKSFSESQMLGFMMVQLGRVAKRYDFPLLSFVQMSRELNVSGSDRILWKCASLSFLARKSPEEMQRHGADQGNATLTVKDARHGPGHEPGDHLNLHFDKVTSKMTEGSTNFELEKGRPTSAEKRFHVDGDPDEVYEPAELERRQTAPWEEASD